MLYTVDGLRWNIIIEGPSDGPVALLLHGFPDTSELWRSQIDALTSCGLRVVVPDMLGFGGSDKPQDPKHYTLRNISNHLAKILDHLDVKSVKLVGHDWGASVAWIFVMMFPHRVERFAALSVGHPGGGVAAGGNKQRARWWYMMYFQYVGKSEAGLQADDWALFRDFMHGESRATVQQYIDSLSPPGNLSASLNWYRANVRPELFSATKLRSFPQLACPVLGMWSTRDVACTEEQVTVSKEYVNPGLWQYHRIVGAGHWMQRDAPEQVSQILVEFLTRSPAKL